jgi:hypothetical protein
VACAPCAAKAAARRAAQAGQSTGTEGSWTLRLPNGDVEKYSTELAARDANRRLHKGAGLVRRA